jgi:hypothetical protein
MSKKIKSALLMILIGILFSFPVLANTVYDYPASFPDGTYIPKQEVKKEARTNESLIKKILSDFSTSANVYVNTQSQDSGPINQVNVTAVVSASKGMVNVSFTHSRNYYKTSNPFYESSASEFQSTVNNSISVGVNFSPNTYYSTNIVGSTDQNAGASSVLYSTTN